MCVAALTAGNVEDTRAGVESENVDQPRDVLAIALEREEWLVFE